MDETICDIASRSNVSECVYLSAECDNTYYYFAREFYCSPTTFPRFSLAATSLGLLVCASFLVLSIGIISSAYLLNSVTKLTGMLHLRHDMLGYLVIPLMNGVPDIVNSHLMIKSKSMNLVMGQIIGANLISFTIIVGSISILRPFKVVNKKSLLIGYSFVCMMMLMLSYVLLDGQVSALECLMLTSLYPIHILIAALDRSVEETDLERSLLKDPSTEVTHLLIYRSGEEEITNLPMPASSFQSTKMFWNKFTGVVELILFFFIPVSKPSLAHPSITLNSLKKRLISSVWFQIWLTMISTVLWNNFSFELPFTILQYILVLVFAAFTILRNVLDQETSDLMTDVACVMNSLMLVTVITKVLIRLLKNLGIIWQISEYIMGLLVFSLVSCLNDILMNTSLAMKVSPSLGIKACMSSCCLLISIGIGFNGLWELLGTALKTGYFSRSLSLPVSLTRELYVSLVALNITVITALAYMILNKWRLDKTLGFSLFGVWVIATGTCVVMELQ